MKVEEELARVALRWQKDDSMSIWSEWSKGCRDAEALVSEEALLEDEVTLLRREVDRAISIRQSLEQGLEQINDEQEARNTHSEPADTLTLALLGDEQARELREVLATKSKDYRARIVATRPNLDGVITHEDLLRKRRQLEGLLARRAELQHQVRPFHDLKEDLVVAREQLQEARKRAHLVQKDFEMLIGGIQL